MNLHLKTDTLLCKVGEKLSKMRHLRNEKITVVAKAVKVSHSVISQVEHGK